MQFNGSRRAGRRGQRGLAMMYACFGVLAAATTLAVALSVALSGSRQATTNVRSTRARYLAEAAVEQAKRDLAVALANWQPVPAEGTSLVPGLSATGTSVAYTLTPTGLDTLSTDAAGIQTLITGYAVEARAELDGFAHTAHRLVNAEATPLFQFAVFYTDDLEVNPGPNMTLGGRVHSNADMYLNCGGTLTLNTNYVRAVGRILRQRKDDTAQSLGTVNVRRWVVNPFDPLESASYRRMNSQSQMAAALGYDPGSGYDSRFSEGVDANGDGDFDDPGDWYDFVAGAPRLWNEPGGYAGGSGSTLLTGQHGVTQALVPHVGSIAMYEPFQGGSYAINSGSGRHEFVGPGNGSFEKGFYHSNADLSVITYADGSFKAFDSAGVDVSGSLGGALSRSNLYDARQAGGGAGNVSVTNLDLGALAASGNWPSNGLIYAAHYGAGTGTAAKGVRLVNGSALPGKLTVVSENSVYIKGDFNTVNKQGAAVIADAVNLLSNAWNDTKTSSSGLPAASNTTYNVAIITGNTATALNGAYNGGLENLPRFHENWSGRTCQIRGSFVNAWRSKYATGNWAIGGKYYQAPNRNWNYDTAFNTVANLPPFTPMAVTTVDVCAW